MRCFLILVLVSLTFASYDINGYGVLDWHQSILNDKNKDGTFDNSTHTKSAKVLSDSIKN